MREMAVKTLRSFFLQALVANQGLVRLIAVEFASFLLCAILGLFPLAGLGGRTGLFVRLVEIVA